MIIYHVKCPHCSDECSILYGATVICGRCGEKFSVQDSISPKKVVQMSVPKDDDPQDFKELAEACLLDMARYANDDIPNRMWVSIRAYRKRFNLIAEQEAT